MASQAWACGFHSTPMSKILSGGERKINGNVKPFTKAESHFVDERFFKENDAPKETMSSTIKPISKGGMKNAL